MSRLEEIKKHIVWTVDNGLQPRISDYDLVWFINRVEELERDRDALEVKIDKSYSNESRYKQALEEIALETGTPYADIAIKVLEETE